MTHPQFAEPICDGNPTRLERLLCVALWIGAPVVGYGVPLWLVLA